MSDDLDEREPSFCDLHYLLDFRRVSIGTLAEAIERVGIQGWDKFGRFKTFKKETPEAQGALAVLAAQYEYEEQKANGRVDWMGPLDTVDLSEPSPFHMGWKAADLPPLAEIAARADGEPTRADRPNKRNENANLAIIAGLLEIIRGKAGDLSGKSDQEIKDALVSYMTGVPGVGRSNLDKRFSEANALLKNC